jgi:Na+-transporting methylmalonyl-CoA/oxaloacetate decarboxylase gamma subunit
MFAHGMIQLAEFPLAEGLTVFAYGFTGVFLALAMLAVGIRVVSAVVGELDSAEKSDQA